MASNLKEDIKKEIRKLKNLGVTETQKAMLEGLYDKVDEASGDLEVRKALWANRDLTSRLFTIDDFKIMPKVGDIVMGPVPDGKVNLDKEFGKDWTSNYGNIPVTKIQFVADKHGLDWKQLSKEMEQTATAQARHDIAYNGAPGKLLSIFGRRQQEAIARGEDPSAKDYIGDIGENALYAVPWGRAIGATGKLGAAAQFAVANSTAPVASETYDAAVYDNENPRGQFSIGDVGTGIATNMTAPYVLNRLTGKFARYMPFMKHMDDLGMINAKSQEQIVKQMNKPHTPQSTVKALNTRLERGYNLTPAQEDLAATYKPEYKETFDKILKKLRNGEKLDKVEINFAKADPYLNEIRYGQYAPTEAQLMSEEALKNLATNEAPNLIGDESLPWYTRIPGGTQYYKWSKEKEQEEEDLKKQKEIEDKWKIIFGSKR